MTEAKERQALREVKAHIRVEDQGLVPTGQQLDDLVQILPKLRPFRGEEYAEVRAILDWDHQLPSQYLVLRILANYSAPRAQGLRMRLSERDKLITRDNLYPEFDLPDYGELSADEVYVGVIPVGESDITDLRFSSEWRREVDPELAAKAVAKVERYPRFQKALRERQNDALGKAVVIGWAPPCLARSEHWAIEVWLVVEFNGHTGKAQVFMVDSDSWEVTHEHLADVQVA